MIWNRNDWQAFYIERSAIAEIDGSMSRKAADALAHGACVREWMERNKGTYNESREALAAMGVKGATK